MIITEMIERKKRLNQVRKECFDARNDLIVMSNKKILEKQCGCIRLEYTVGCAIINPWSININPEKTYRTVGPRISYCEKFDEKNPMAVLCENTSCPMYSKYMRYINKCKSMKSDRVNKR